MKQGKCCVVCNLVCALVILGALNWGLIGATHHDLVVKLLGGIPKAVLIVYLLIGLAGVIKLISCFKPCPCCKEGTCEKK